MRNEESSYSSFHIPHYFMLEYIPQASGRT